MVSCNLNHWRNVPYNIISGLQDFSWCSLLLVKVHNIEVKVFVLILKRIYLISEDP